MLKNGLTAGYTFSTEITNVQKAQKSGNKGNSVRILKGWEKCWIELRAGLHIFSLAIRNYGSTSRSVKVLKTLYLFKKSILGGIETKIVKADSKYYHSIYAPGYPSEAFDRYIEAEFHRISPLKKKTNFLNFIFFAITSKCPLQCEHCFEWNNLNKAETFSLEELKSVVNKFQAEGITQFHFSGGEPMVRIKDLLQLIAGSRKDSEFYVLTSGFNFTAAHAVSLKQAGLTGVVISLDHFEPEKHNAFRGFRNSYNDVIKAVQNASEQNLIVVLTICATKTFISQGNLIKYAELAKSLNVPFIQILEPKAIGHYENTDVCLNENHICLLEEFYHKLNFDPDYVNYPIIIYHGYHQRRIGCLAGGNRTLYIDCEGFVNACPFCHTKNFNIRNAIQPGINIPSAMQSMGCQRY